MENFCCSKQQRLLQKRTMDLTIGGSYECVCIGRVDLCNSGVEHRTQVAVLSDYYMRNEHFSLRLSSRRTLIRNWKMNNMLMNVAAVRAIRLSSSLNWRRNISFVVFVLLKFFWAATPCCIVFEKKITVCIGLFGFRPFVDHISVIMLFHFRWSNQIKKKHTHTPSDQRQNRRVREWAAAVIVIVYFVVCFIFSAWSLRYPAESNNATGFFYMIIIICSVINTLTPERMKWKKEWNK